MARSLIKAALEAAWHASADVQRQGGTAMDQLAAGIRAYLDYIADRSKQHRLEQKERREQERRDRDET